MVINGEKVKTWKDAVVAYFKTVFCKRYILFVEVMEFYILLRRTNEEEWYSWVI
jgi:hypothetical protein